MSSLWACVMDELCHAIVWNFRTSSLPVDWYIVCFWVHIACQVNKFEFCGVLCWRRSSLLNNKEQMVYVLFTQIQVQESVACNRTVYVHVCVYSSKLLRLLIFFYFHKDCQITKFGPRNFFCAANTFITYSKAKTIDSLFNTKMINGSFLFSPLQA